MKYIFVFLLVFSTQVCMAQSEEDSVQTAVRQWIESKLLEYPGTYAPTEFLEFEERTGLSEEAERQKKQWLLAHHNELTRIAEDSTATPLPDDKKEELLRLKENATDLTEEHIGYKVRHRFSARDKFGNPLFYDGEFTLDTDFVIQETVIKESSESEERTN